MIEAGTFCCYFLGGECGRLAFCLFCFSFFGFFWGFVVLVVVLKITADIYQVKSFHNSELLIHMCVYV